MRTADLEPVGATFQRLGRVDGYTFVGSGKVAEIAANARALDASFVVFDDELSFSQQRNLQREFESLRRPENEVALQVLDRTQLILEIFSRRARTKEAKMQVELAKAEYMLPRLQTFMTTGAGMDSEGGSGGGGGGGGAFPARRGRDAARDGPRLFGRRSSASSARSTSSARSARTSAGGGASARACRSSQSSGTASGLRERARARGARATAAASERLVPRIATS